MAMSRLETAAAPAATPRAEALAQGLAASPARTLWRDVWRRYRRHRLAMMGSAVLVTLSLGIVRGPWLYPTPIDAIDFAVKLQGPSLAHPFGTDDLGQDLPARLLYGGRISLAVGVVAMGIAIVLGVVIGALAGFCGVVVDTLLMRLTDLFLSLPQLPLLVVFLFREAMRQAFGPEVGVFILMVGVIGGLRWMQPARLVRAAFLALKEQEFVEAARCLGVPNGRLIVRHILPNALRPVIVAATLGVASAILAESSLSFLGLAFPPDMPTWGRLLADARDYLDLAPHLALFPGLMIFLAVIAINYIGDGLRDALDPRKRL
jgi:peptide/nickel transport system permease protein